MSSRVSLLFKKAIDSKSHKFIVVSVSEEARTSLAVRFNLDSSRVHWQLRDYFHHLAGDDVPVMVVDASIATDVALVETRAEFLERFREEKRKGSMEETRCKCCGEFHTRTCHEKR